MRGHYGARASIRRGVAAIYHTDDVHNENSMRPIWGWYMSQCVSWRTLNPSLCNVGPLWDYSGTTIAVCADAMRVFGIAGCARATTWPTRAWQAPRELRLAGTAHTERAAGLYVSIRGPLRIRRRRSGMHNNGAVRRVPTMGLAWDHESRR
jgi:hypothetical protein